MTGEFDVVYFFREFLIYLKKSFGLNVVCYASLNDRLSGCDLLEIMCTEAGMACIKLRCIRNLLEQLEEPLIIS